jgi:hypothetical protein
VWWSPVTGNGGKQFVQPAVVVVGVQPLYIRVGAGNEKTKEPPGTRGDDGPRQHAMLVVEIEGAK